MDINSCLSIYVSELHMLLDFKANSSQYIVPAGGYTYGGMLTDQISSKAGAYLDCELW
jgi:hypothetical protein